jgi:hypothetical protein
MLALASIPFHSIPRPLHKSHQLAVAPSSLHPTARAPEQRQTMARRLLRPSSHGASLASVVLLVVVLLLATSSTVSATPEERYGHRHQHRGRRMLVTAPRVSSPETTRTGAQQHLEMGVGGWLAATPFMGARASLGRRIPRSQGNPSHN